MGRGWLAVPALAAVTACASGGGVEAQRVEGVEWQLVALDGAVAPAGDRGQPLTLHLDPLEVRASGFGGCNRFFGAYELDGTKLSFGMLAMTMKACPEGMAAEQSYHQALGRVDGYRVEGAELLLLQGDGVVARYREESGAND